MAPFFLSVKGTAEPNGLNVSGKLNLAKLTIQFCFQLVLSLGLKAEDVIEHVT